MSRGLGAIRAIDRFDVSRTCAPSPPAPYSTPDPELRGTWIGRTSIEPNFADGIRENLDRIVQVLGFDQVVAAELLFGLGERTVGGGDLPATRADSGGGIVG